MIESFFSRFVPNQAGALWIGIVVAVVVFGDAKNIRSSRNVALAGLFLLAPLMLDIIHWHGNVAAWLFTGILLVTAGYVAWGIYLGFYGSDVDWSVNLTRGHLKVVLAFLVALNVSTALGREPDDSGIYSNLGAQRWLETGTLPYGDVKLKGPAAPGYGAAATYGPLLYASHIPFQVVLGGASNPSDADPIDDSYVMPPLLATQLACLAFYLVGLVALYRVMLLYSDGTTALAVTALYAAMPYVQGLGGDEYVANGLAHISHIAPAAVMLMAFLLINRPLLSGVLLATAAGVLYYPAFLFPLWLGYFVWRREGALRFGAGFAVAGAAIAMLVIAFTDAPPGASTTSLFLESTLEHQEGVGQNEYGLSRWSFWGTHPKLASFWQEPLVGSTSLFKPTFLLVAGLSLAAFFFPRGRSPVHLAGFTAAIIAAILLWKTHATGWYVTWYLPFLLIALFNRVGPQPEPSEG